MTRRFRSQRSAPTSGVSRRARTSPGRRLRSPPSASELRTSTGLLPTDLQHAFDEQLTLCRTVFPHVESHGFYVDHWYHTLFWNKVREFGTLLARHGFLADAEDVFFLQHGEVRTALEEIRVDWGTGGAGQARGPHYWPPIVERRKAIYGAMREWAPPPALGNVPETLHTRSRSCSSGSRRSVSRSGSTRAARTTTC